jgi:hypothetical protein
LIATGLSALLRVDSLIFPLATAAAAALGLPHAVLDVLRREIRLPVLLAG